MLFSGRSDSEARPPSKRQRLHGACDACKRKKIKCDSAITPGRCSNCINFKTPCTHDSAHPYRQTVITMASGSDARDEYVRNLEERIKSLEERLYLQSLALAGPVSDSTQGQTSTLNQTSIPIPASRIPDSDPRSNSGANSPCTPSDGRSDDEQITEKFKGMCVTPGILDNRFFGTSSMLAFAQDTIASKLESSGIGVSDGQSGPGAPLPVRDQSFWTRREGFWTTAGYRQINQLHNASVTHFRSTFEPKSRYTFPDQVHLNDLISLYFEYSAPLLPIIHRVSFEADVKAGRHHVEDGFAKVVLVVCALGARFLGKEERSRNAGSGKQESSADSKIRMNPPEGGENTRTDDVDTTPGWQYISQIPVVPPLSAVWCTLPDLQYLVLASIFYIGTSVPHAAWILPGIGLRLSQDRGVHRRNNVNPQTKVEKVEVEQWRRAFWGFVILDRLISSYLGRTCALYDEDIDTDYPDDFDEEFLASSQPSSSADATQSSTSTSTSEASCSIFKHFIELGEIIGTMMCTIYASKQRKERAFDGYVGDWWEERATARLQTSLDRWKASLPAKYRWDPRQPKTRHFFQSIFLHSFYHYIQIQVKRPMFQRKRRFDVIQQDNDPALHLALSSMHICAHAAHSLADIIDVSVDKTGFTSPILTMFSSAAAIVLLIRTSDMRRGQNFIPGETPYDPSDDLVGIRKCMKYLRAGEKYWYSAGRFVDMLTVLSESIADTNPPSRPAPSHLAQSQTHASVRPAGNVDELSMSGFVSTMSSSGPGISLTRSNSVPVILSNPIPVPYPRTTTTSGNSMPLPRRSNSMTVPPLASSMPASQSRSIPLSYSSSTMALPSSDSMSIPPNFSLSNQGMAYDHNQLLGSGSYGSDIVNHSDSFSAIPAMSEPLPNPGTEPYPDETFFGAPFHQSHDTSESLSNVAVGGQYNEWSYWASAPQAFSLYEWQVYADGLVPPDGVNSSS